jgi:hypothetical protein
MFYNQRVYQIFINSCFKHKLVTKAICTFPYTLSCYK